MIPAMHRRGRHWPTMHRPVPVFRDDRLDYVIGAGPAANGIIAWLALVALVAVAVVVPTMVGSG